MVETALERSDLEALLGVVAGLAAVRPLADLRSDTVAALPSLVSSDHPAWNEVDPVTGEIAAAIPLEFEQSIGDRMPHLTAVFARHVDEHPVIADYRRTGNGRPQAISDFVSAEAFHATALYQHFYAVFGTEDQLSFVLPAPDMTIGITVDRPERSFKARDREILNLLRPHLIQAYRNALALEAATAALEAVDSLAEASGDGVIVLDRLGKIVHSTPTACTLLDRHFSGHPPAGLPTELADYVARTASQSAPAWPMMQDGLVVRRLSSAGTTVLVLWSCGWRASSRRVARARAHPSRGRGAYPHQHGLVDQGDCRAPPDQSAHGRQARGTIVGKARRRQPPRGCEPHQPDFSVIVPYHVVQSGRTIALGCGSLAEEPAHRRGHFAWAPSSRFAAVGQLHGPQPRGDLQPSQGFGSHRGERCPTQGKWTSAVSAPVMRSASVRPARLVVATPSPT